MTSRETLAQWFDEAVAKGARWLIIGYDNFSHEAHPIPVLETEDVWGVLKDQRNDMGAGYKEVYDLTLSKESQIATNEKVFNMPPRPVPRSIFRRENVAAKPPEVETSDALLGMLARVGEARVVSPLQHMKAAQDDLLKVEDGRFLDHLEGLVEAGTALAPKKKRKLPTRQERIDAALELVVELNGSGAHHKQYLIDQIVRTLLGSEKRYKAWVAAFEMEDEEGDALYAWDVGIAP